MSKREQYAVAHKLAKLIVFFFNTGLILLMKVLDIDILPLLLVINFTYFFGVNTTAYSIETVLKFKHKHDKI